MSGTCRVHAAWVVLLTVAGPAAALPPAPVARPYGANDPPATLPPVAPGFADKPAPAAPPAAAPRDTTRDPLNRLLDPQDPVAAAAATSDPNAADPYPFLPTIGFAGPSGVIPRSGGNNEYDTMED